MADADLKRAFSAVIDWSVNPVELRVAERAPIGNNRVVLQSVFPLVVFGAVAFSVVMSLIFLFSRGSAYDQIGDSGSRDRTRRRR